MICKQCHEYFLPRTAQQQFCSKSCAVKYRRRNQPPREPNQSLSQWIIEARECNLDYGTYRALIRSGKTFEELKAVERNLPVHASRGHWLSVD